MIKSMPLSQQYKSYFFFKGYPGVLGGEVGHTCLPLLRPAVQTQTLYGKLGSCLQFTVQNFDQLVCTGFLCL